MKQKATLTVATLALAVFGLVALTGPAFANGRGNLDGHVGAHRGAHRGGFGGHGGPGLGRGDDDRGTLLATELGITVEDLQAARFRALDKGLAAEVKAGRLTQVRADLMLAGAKLGAAIDRDAVTAEALGITVDALEAARAADKTLRDLLTEHQLNPAKFRAQLAAAMDKAIAKAVADGVVTQAQADALKAAKNWRGQMHGPRGGNGGGRAPLDAPLDGGATNAPVSSDA